MCLCFPCKLWSLGLHVLGETKAETGTVVLSWTVSKAWELLCFGAASVPGAVVMVEDMHEKKKQRMGSEKG